MLECIKFSQKLTCEVCRFFFLTYILNYVCILNKTDYMVFMIFSRKMCSVLHATQLFMEHVDRSLGCGLIPKIHCQVGSVRIVNIF